MYYVPALSKSARLEPMFFVASVMYHAHNSKARCASAYNYSRTASNTAETCIASPPDYSRGLLQPTCAQRAHFD
eukprot:6214409-Pleurochrysis_carterae.AAC.2